MPPSRIFILVNDAHYFGNIDAVEGGTIKLDTKGTQTLLSTWEEGDLALVWIENTKKPAAYFNILDVQPRSDLIGHIEEYDDSLERPHRIQLDNGNYTRMDLRRDSFRVVHQSNGKVVSNAKLCSPFESPLAVRICWQVYKYTVHGEKLHFLKDSDIDQFPPYTPNRNGYSLLQGEESLPYLKALETVKGFGTPSAKRKLDHIAPDVDGTPKKKKIDTPAKKPTPSSSSSSTKIASTKSSSNGKKSPRKTPTIATKSSMKSPSTTTKSPSSTKKSPSTSTTKKTPIPTTPSGDVTFSLRTPKRPDYYSPTSSPSSSSSAPKTPTSTSKPIKSPKSTKQTVKKGKSPLTIKKSSSSPSSPSPSSSSSHKKRVLDEGTLIAVRADSGRDFVVARVRKPFVVPAQGADRTHATVKVTWLVEAREADLHRCYTAPDWPAQVTWGAVVKTNLHMRYEKDKDMYRLLDKPADIVALV